MDLFIVTQVSPAEEGRARLSGGTTALPGREEPGAAGQGRVGRTGNPVRQRPADRSLQSPKPAAEAGRHSLAPNPLPEKFVTGRTFVF